MELLKDLNETGSFGDESEKTPMCYIHCVLTKMEVINKEGQINVENAGEAYKIKEKDVIDECNNEMGK
jgi:hypothetical protein